MNAPIPAAIVTFHLAFCGLAIAHPGHEDAPPPPAGVPGDQAAAPGAASQVKIEVHDGFRFITANGMPDHATGKFPGRGNPNSISPQSYTFRVAEKPVAAEHPVNVGAAGQGRPPMLVGVALNGVVFDPGTAEWWNDDRSSGWNYEALSGKIDLGVDSSNAHVQPNGAYHYHGTPNGLIDRIAGAGKGSRMVQVGWAADGFPMYAQWGYDKASDASSAVRVLKSSYRIKSGNRPAGEKSPGGKYDGTFVQDYEYVKGLGDLDECNGRTGPTPEFPGGTYYYVITTDYPFVPRLFRGTPDESFRKQPPRGGGPRGRGGPGPGGGPPGDRPVDKGQPPSDPPSPAPKQQ